MANPNLADLEAALVNADAAGDTEAASTLAGEITRLRGAPAAGEQPSADLNPIQKLNKWISDRMPAPVNEAVDVAGQPASGVLEGITRLALLPADMQKAVDSLTDSLSEPSSPAGKGVKAVLMANPMMQLLVGSSMLRKKLGLPDVAGSEEASRGLMEAGVTAPEPTTATGRVTRRVGQEVGASALTAVPVLRAAAQAPNLAKSGQGILAQTVNAARTDPTKFLRQEATVAASGGLGAAIAKEIAPESSAAEVFGLMTGSVAPTAVAGTLRGIVRGGDGTRRAMQQTIKEFSEAGVEPTVGMATRRRFNQAVESGLAILPGSSGRMAAYSEKTARQLYDRVDDVTAGIARVRSPDAAGTSIKQGVAGFVSRFKDKWRSMDARVAQAVKPTTAVNVPETRAALAEISTDPALLANRPGVKRLVESLEEFAQTGAMSYKDVRTFRTSIGSQIPDAYSGDVPAGVLKKFYGAMSKDVRAHLAATDPAALRAFDRSSRYYTAAMKRLDESLAPLTSTDIPERVFLALERSGHAGPTVINAAKRSIGRQNWDVVVGTLFHRMGLAPAGAQGASADTFSVSTFLTNWNKYGRNPNTLPALLGGTSGGSGFVKDMNAIAKVTERFREAGRVFANPSGTARAIANVGLGTSVVTSLLGGQFKTAGTILGVALAANLSAGAFTNPKFVHFLAQATRVPAARVPSLVTRLGSQLASEPEAVQVEIAHFLDSLSDVFSAQAQDEQSMKPKR